MASGQSQDEHLFDQDKISQAISAADAPSFFLKYGVFYQTSAELGELVGPPDEIDFNKVKQICYSDQRLRNILEPYMEHGPVTQPFNLDENKRGAFYVFTTEQDVGNRLFFMIAIPYPQLRLNGCVKAELTEGGA
ncbi:fatty acid desaturase [Apiospora arundinis]